MKRRCLHIGCGKAYIQSTEASEWVNHDLFSSVQADFYADMMAMGQPPQSFDLIYASHVLEHTHRNCVLATLYHWRDMLKPGGTLRLAVPNFEAVSAYYQQTGDLPVLLGLLYAGQNHPKNTHNVIFDETTLARDLMKVGFVNIRTWDWRKTEHAHYDDFSQCYLPHMQKDKGMLMSLNMEADRA